MSVINTNISSLTAQRNLMQSQASLATSMPVSYTHLDVYKRQALYLAGIIQNTFGGCGGHGVTPYSASAKRPAIKMLACNLVVASLSTLDGVWSVSYTHLDVYKRQFPGTAMSDVPALFHPLDDDRLKFFGVGCHAGESGVYFFLTKVSNSTNEGRSVENSTLRPNSMACLLYTSRCV